MTLVTRIFEALFISTIRAKGSPDLPYIVVPYPFDHLPEPVIREEAVNRLGEVARALTKE